MKLNFVARSGEQAIPLSVEMPYQPGNHTQRARRLAVGELLARLEATTATVDAGDATRVVVTTEQGEWVIGESFADPPKRGLV